MTPLIETCSAGRVPRGNNGNAAESQGLASYLTAGSGIKSGSGFNCQYLVKKEPVEVLFPEARAGGVRAERYPNYRREPVK